MRQVYSHLLPGVLCFSLFSGFVLPAGAAVEVALAEAGQARQAIVVAASAAPATRALAQEVAACLQRISGATFAIEEGDGTTGMAIGRAADFPALGMAAELPTNAVWEAAERYTLRTHDRGVWLLGATEAAVSHAVWDFLAHIGYRQYFPTETWEVVPSISDLRLALDLTTQPHYAGRNIWFSFGTFQPQQRLYARWCARNRMQAQGALNTGHAYDGIISRNRKLFEQHPEYYGLVNGERRSSKFCIGNPEVRALVARDALAQFEKNPDLKSVSIDPSDGSGWCECEACVALGSISDRQVTLANEAAAAVANRFPGKLVCFYAYNMHSPPPTVRVASNVVVSIATAFVKGGFTVEQLFDGWNRAGARLGVREYYSITTWDRDLPGAARGSNLAYLRRTIPQFYASGARFVSAESSDNWGPNGLGYYLAAQMLWDTNAARRVEEISTRFFADCFGAASAPMREFYGLLDGSRRNPLSSDLLGRLYRALQKADELAGADPAIRRRLDDLALYLHYVEIFRDYRDASGGGWRPVPAGAGSGAENAKPPRQAAFETLIRYIYRIRDRQLVHSLGLLRDLPARDKTVWMDENARFNAPEIIKNKKVPLGADLIDGITANGLDSLPTEKLAQAAAESTNEWKIAKPFTRGETDAIIAAGVTNHQLVTFTPVRFSEELVPVGHLQLRRPPTVKAGDDGQGAGRLKSSATRGAKRVYFWAETQPVKIDIQVTAGLIYNNLGNAVIELFPLAEPNGLAVDSASIAPDREVRTVTLKSEYEGLHHISWRDNTAKTQIDWPQTMGFTWPCSDSLPFDINSAQLYFYVPRGTRTIGGRTNAGMVFIDPDGNRICAIERQRSVEYFTVDVPEGSDGAIWGIRGFLGSSLALMSVPPYVAFLPDDLLVPREALE